MLSTVDRLAFAATSKGSPSIVEGFMPIRIKRQAELFHGAQVTEAVQIIEP
jgi:hypothetical protein